MELFTTSRRKRALVRRHLQRVYRIARVVTRAGGGDGPWVFRVDVPRIRSGLPRIREIFDVRPEEDLWVEMVFYPDRRSMRAIIRRIWKDADFVTVVRPLERLSSKRVRTSSVDVASLLSV